MRHVILFLFLSAGMSAAFAAGGDYKLDEANIDSSDAASLQRGSKLFVQRCLSCHAAAFMRYNRLTDIGLNENQIREYLIFDDSVKVGDTMKNTLLASDARVMFGVEPPDLSVISRSRGADWLYTYLKGFYKDNTSVTGWNNVVFPNVAMPNVFWQEQGVLLLTDDPSSGDSQMAYETPGSMSTVEFDNAMRDLTNYLVFMGEPAGEKRKQIGSLVIIFLIFFAFLAWALKREFWKDIH